MERKIGKVVVAIAVVVVLAAFLPLLLSSRKTASWKPLPMPDPNGYTDLVKAGQMLTNAVSEYRDMDRAELAALVASSTNALRLARQGLNQECRVTLQYSGEYLSNQVQELPALRKLAFLLVAEGKLAELNRQPDKAAKSYLDAIHLGIESARGGVMINALVGIAIESMGAQGLQNLRDQLDAKTCRETAAALEQFDAQRQSWSDVLQQEKEWTRRAFPGFRQRLAAFLMSGALKKTYEKMGNKFKQQQLTTCRLMIDLAARAYQLEKGAPPAHLADIVPAYLKAIPQDPLTGTNMSYLP